MLNGYGTKLISVKSHIKSSQAERVILTLRQKLRRIQTEKQTLDFRPYWDSIVRTYNATPHSATGFAPVDINEENQHIVLNNLYSKYISKTPKKLEFLVGTYVRISKYKLTFEKASTSDNWSREVFKITGGVQAVPRNYYYLTDLRGESIEGSFYSNELEETVNPEDG